MVDVAEEALRIACEEIAAWRDWYGQRELEAPERPSRREVDDIVAEMKEAASVDEPEDALG